MVKFQEKFELFNQPGLIKSDCNSILIINVGTATALLNGYPIIPNAFYSSDGNINEFNETTYRVQFQGAGTTQLLIVRKFYN